MRILCIDLSLHCGYAVIESSPSEEALVEGQARLVEYGTLHYDGVPAKKLGNYPWSYIDVVEHHVGTIIALSERIEPAVIVIEETNKGKNRYSQKMLEFLHHELLTRLMEHYEYPRLRPSVVYLDTSHWRSVLGIWLTKDQKKNNAKLSKAKRDGKEALKAMKEKLGVRGKTNKKHAAIAHANATFGLKLKVKDNDAADAICLGLAYLKGATPSNGE